MAPELLGLLAQHPAVNTALHHELVSVLTLLHAGARTQAWFSNTWVHVRPLQSCPTLCDPMDCSPPGSSVHRDSPGKNSGVGCHAFLQGIFPTQVCSPCLLCLLHWQADSLPLHILQIRCMIPCATAKTQHNQNKQMGPN